MNNQADVAIAFALAQVGKPYQWGKAGPESYDCSGLIVAAFARAGITLPHSTYLLVNLGQSVPANALAPGDLVFPEAGHVQLYLGAGKIVEAPTAGINVRVVNQWGGVWRARRVTSEPGTGATVPTSSASGISDAANITPAGFSLSDFGTAFSDIGKGLSYISNPHNWVRLFEFLIGLGLLLFAIYHMSKDA